MKKFFYNLVLLVSVSVLPVAGQNDTSDLKNVKFDALRENFRLFGNDEMLEASMRLDLTSFVRKKLNGSAIDAVFTIHLNSTDSLTSNIKVKARGKYRYDNCSFPPMELSFKKQLHAYSDSDYVKKIKFVTHCVTGASSDEFVLREYLVYKLFNIVTDTSYRVRLVRITYIDSENKRKPVTQYGFFIEPDEHLATRINSTIVKTKNLTQKHIWPEMIDKVSIFNYMIGNWDWNVPNLQNITVFKPVLAIGAVLGLAVPYDFDLCGLVNVNYGFAPEEYGLKSSRDRVFLGICRSKEDFRKDMYYFLNRKDEIYTTINDFAHLNQRSKKDMTNFLNQFYFQIEKERDLDYFLEYLVGACKKL